MSGLSYEGRKLKHPWDLDGRRRIREKQRALKRRRRERDRRKQKGEDKGRNKGGILECSLRCLVTDKDRYATPGGLGPRPVTRTDNR